MTEKKKQISFEERKFIEKCLKDGIKVGTIAIIINRAKSTIYWEVNKHGGLQNYNAEEAQKDCRQGLPSSNQFVLPLEVKESLNQKFKGNFSQDNTEIISRIESLEMQVQILTETIRSLRNHD